jgi:hypothetical protein
MLLGGGLAGVVWQTAAQQGSDTPLWPAYIFSALAVVGAYGMVASLLQWPPWRPRRDHAPAQAPRVRPPQERFWSEGTDRELEMTIEREEWHPFEGKALIVEIKLSIHNCSSHTKRLAGGFGIEAPNVQDIEVDREQFQYQKKRALPSSRIEPGETETGWLVAAFPPRPQGGAPTYAVKVDDELRHMYGVRRKETPR